MTSLQFGGSAGELVAGSSAPTPPLTFETADHDVQLRVPDDAMETGTQVRFVQSGQDVINDLISSARGVTAAGKPVDIDVIAGALAPDRVRGTLRYDPELIPAGLTDKQVGMSMFDENLGNWVPLLDAKADPGDATVTATAPHFSRFVSTVLNAAKSVVDIGGKMIQTVIDATVTITQWVTNLSSEILVTLLKDFLGIPEELKCKSLNPVVDVRPTSLLDLLRACAESAADSDVTVRLRNGFAFPLRTMPLPPGIVLRDSDAWNNSADLPGLVRNMYWSSRNQVVVGGTITGTVTAAPELDGAQTVKMDIDSEAISFDMVLAVLTAFAPATALAKSALKAAVRSMLKGAIKAKALTGWIKNTYDALDCVVKAAHKAIDLFGPDSVRAQAQIAAGCLETVLSAAGVKGALGDLIGNVKVFPELVQVVLYPVGSQLGEQLGIYRQQPPSVLVERSQVPGTFVGQWRVHGAQIVINKDGSGNLGWNAGSCTASLTPGPHCWGRATLSFKSGANTTLVGTFVTVWYVDDDGTTVSTYPHAQSGFQPGASFTLVRNDPHTLRSSHGGPGNPYLCDEYAMQHNSSSYQLCGA